MAKTSQRKFFIVRHDLGSFLAWPGVIWRTGEIKLPRALKKIRVGDRWLEYAYIDDERRREKTQQIVGFYECVSLPRRRIQIPARPRALVPGRKWAWAIKGKPIGWQPAFPITVPSIDRLLGRKTFSAQTLTPIKEKEFQKLREKVRAFQLDPAKIPLLSRDPRNEQEVVAILIAAQKKLGIERIDRIRTGFPDLRVKLAKKRSLVHLEVETYSSRFFSHGHAQMVRSGLFRSEEPDERLPVAVICWHDDDRNGLAEIVNGVYSLRTLLATKARIRLKAVPSKRKDKWRSTR